MLRSLSKTTPVCWIFYQLNMAFLHFLENSITAKNFTGNLFPENFLPFCWANQPTKEKFESVWNELQEISADDRQALFDSIFEAQGVTAFFSDKTIKLPDVNQQELKQAIKALTSHLFNNTKTLRPTEHACETTMGKHFASFRKSNGNICCVCGTEKLAQWRDDVSEEDQWKAPYDHLLSKDKYVLFAIHPRNLVPICYTCNSKAKLAKELLFTKDNQRRLSFNPYQESAGNKIHISVTESDSGIGLEAKLVWNENITADEHEKLNTWDDVYQIRSRINGKFCTLTDIIHSRCNPTDLEDLRDQIHRHATISTATSLRNPFGIWELFLFKYLDSHQELSSPLWDMIEITRSALEDLDEEFGFNIPT